MSPPKSIAMGVIGCGRIAQSVHLPLWPRVPGVRVVAVTDPDPTRRAEAAWAVPGAAVYDAWPELLSHPGLSAVVVAAPNAHHAEIACRAFEAGVHVYLEKPLATTHAEAEAVCAAWRTAATVGMIGFNYRFHPRHQAARDALRAGRIGEPVVVHTMFAGMRQEMPGWKQDRATGGGVLLDLASHHVDLVRYYLGDPIQEVAAQQWSRRFPSDTATLELGLASGIRVQSFFSWQAAEVDRFEIHGTSGRLVVDRLAGGWLERVRRRLTPGWELSYPPAFSAFARAILGGGAEVPDLEDGRRALEIILRAEQTAAAGVPMKVG